jgi:lysophospholipase-2
MIGRFLRRRPSLSFQLQLLALIVPRSTSAAFHSSSNMSPSFTTERDGEGTITVSPKNEADQSGLVVICHGLGDSAEGFSDVAESLAQQMPYLKFILPTAPTQPVTMNMGMPMPSWYDIVGLDERANENCKGIDEARARLAGILEREHVATGLPYSRMMLAGFSQGAALALFTGMQLPLPHQKLAGIVVMSGYMPAASQFKLTPGLEDVPILHCHGTQDPMVKFALAEKTKAKVLECGATDYTIKSYPIQHTVSPEELAHVSEFVKKVLPSDDTCKIQLKDPSAMSVKELKAAIKKANLGAKAVGFMEKSEFIRLLQDHRAEK